MNPAKDEMNEMLKREMLEKIKEFGAWFSTRKDNYLKIGYSETDNSYFARECILKDGGLEGGAYSFGTDWFDISFHGKYVELFADPDTFKRWDIIYDREKGTCYKDADGGVGMGKRVLDFCKGADEEALKGGLNPYRIDRAAFAETIELSEEASE